MEFKTQFDEHERVYTNAGDRVKILYAGKYDDNGVLDVVKKGKTDLYMDIQSHADSVDIHVILNRYKNGDLSVLNKVEGSFGDFTQMPKTYAEMLNLMLDKQAEFLQLPTNVREKFGNSFERYMATAGSSDWLDKMGFKPVEPVKAEPVQESAQVDTVAPTV